MSTTDANHPTASPTSPRIALGAVGESLAADHLVDAGMILLARNWRVAAGELRGELDIVAKDADTIAFVEVKTRRGRSHGSPLDAVTVRKQAKIRTLASAFLRETGLRTPVVRFDVVGVLLERERTTVTHLRGAF